MAWYGNSYNFGHRIVWKDCVAESLECSNCGQWAMPIAQIVNVSHIETLQGLDCLSSERNIQNVYQCAFHNLQVDGKRPPEPPRQGSVVSADGHSTFQPQRADSQKQGPHNVKGCNTQRRNQTQPDLAPPQFLVGDTKDRPVRSSITMKKNKSTKLTKEDIGLPSNFQ